MALDFVAGCVGGCAGVIVGHPFDTVKVHLQTQDARRPIYRGTFHCLQTIVAKESARGLFRGMASPIGGVAFVNAIVFGVYGNVQRHHPDPESLKAHFYAGAAAGLTQSIVCSPMELVKTRLQLQEHTKEYFRGPVDCFQKIWRTGRLRGVFQGLGITALRDIPGFSTYFVSYEMMVKKDSSSFHILMAGGLAGVCSWGPSYPIDVIKTRLQMDRTNQYKGIVDCVLKTYKNDGLPVFFRGLSSTLIRAFPVNAVCFLVVSYILQLSDKMAAKTPEIAPNVVTKTRSIVRIKCDDDLDYISRLKSNTIRGLTLMGAFHEDSVHRTEVLALTNNNLHETETQEIYLDFDAMLENSHKIPENDGVITLLSG